LSRKKILVGVLLLAAVASAVGFFWPFGRTEDELRLPGIVEIQEVRLGSKIGGRVADLAVNPATNYPIKEGDVVQAGQPLVYFEEPELKAQEAQWSARVKTDQAAWDRARADLKQMKAQLYQYDRDFRRAQDLLVTRSISTADYDLAEANFIKAKAQIGVGEAAIKQAQYMLEVDRAKLREIQVNLSEAVVRAPSRCVIEVLGVRKGDLVPANQPIIRILKADDLWVKVYVPETQLGMVRLNQKASVTIDSYPGRQFEGTVIQIASISEFTPRNVQSADERRHQVFGVKVRVDNSEGIFKSGMAAEVRVPLR
jgi:multidrug resistance efflux pump